MIDPHTERLMMGAAGAGEKTYVDDVFSTYLYKGTGSAVTVNNGIDISGEGGMTWIKSRTDTHYHNLIDTVRGPTKAVFSNHSMGQDTGTNGYMTSFNNNGFTTGTYNNVTNNNQDFTSWTFRKQEGFFDVVTWTGDGTSGRQIAHNLGSVPGCIMVKCLSHAQNWAVYHKGATPSNQMSNHDYNYRLYLNENSPPAVQTAAWNNTAPTKTHFTLGDSLDVNGGSKTYVAYVYAGDGDGYNSVEFDGSSDYLKINSSGDFNFGTGDFTVEGWFNRKVAANHDIFCLGDASQSGTFEVYLNNVGGVNFYVDGESRINTTSPHYGLNEWCHMAIVRNSGSVVLYLNGTAIGSAYSSTGNIGNGKDFYIGKEFWNSNSYNYMNGYISNVRVVKGQALYTSNFTPTTSPLTITSQGINPGVNVATLCCNGDLPTSMTTNNDLVQAFGDVSTGNVSPFGPSPDSIFGEDGDKGIIKCGYYRGTGSSRLEVNIGWEPQYLIIKSSQDISSPWNIYDNLRGIATEYDDMRLEADTSDAEKNGNWIELTPTGFRIIETNSDMNSNTKNYVYIAIRATDGYVGKPALVGTDAFAMDVGNNSSSIPAYDSGFTVGMAFHRQPASSSNWLLSSRMMGKTRYLSPNLTAEETDLDDLVLDSNVGWVKSYNSTYQSWMFKRGQGFEVSCYRGTGASGRKMNHNLNRAPEMIWVKKRKSGSKNWYVYHKGINGGSSPQNYSLRLNTTAAQDSDGNTVWNQEAPTSTTFTISTDSGVNNNGDKFVAFLFASVDGISKCGYYDGSSSDITITTGFIPRFILIKRTNGGSYWHLFDSLRGMGASGNDAKLLLNMPNAEDSSKDFVNTTATGFVVKAGADGDTSTAGGQYIYYAHA